MSNSWPDFQLIPSRRCHFPSSLWIIFADSISPAGGRNVVSSRSRMVALSISDSHLWQLNSSISLPYRLDRVGAKFLIFPLLQCGDAMYEKMREKLGAWHRRRRGEESSRGDRTTQMDHPLVVLQEGSLDGGTAVTCPPDFHPKMIRVRT